MLSELGTSRRPMVGGNNNNETSFGDDDLEKEIGLLLRDQRRQEADDRERELNLYRSGSAPPTVEGSLNAVGGLYGGGFGVDTTFSEFAAANNGSNVFAGSEEELRSDPAYLKYYYSNANLNPRFPPPLLSKEDWRSTQRVKGGSSAAIGDRKSFNRGENSGNNNRSFFSMPPGFDSRKPESDVESDKLNGAGDWGVDGLIGLSGVGMGNKQKSLAEIFQNDLGCATPVTGTHSSRPASRNAFDENVDTLGSAEAELAHLRHGGIASDVLLSSANGQTVGQPSPFSYAAALGGTSLSRSTTPDPQLIARIPSPCPTPIGGERTRNSARRAITPLNETADLVNSLSGMNISSNGVDEQNHLTSSKLKQEVQNHQNYLFGQNQSMNGHDLNHSSLIGDRQADFQKSGHSYMKASPTSTLSYGSLPAHYQHADNNASFSNYGLNGYSLNPSMMASQLGNGNLSPLYETSQNLGRVGTQMGGNSLQTPFVDPVYLQYLRTSEYAAQLAALNDPSMDRNVIANQYMIELQKAYLALLSPQKAHYQLGGKSGVSNHQGYYGSSPFGVGLSYPGSPLANPVIPNSPLGPGSPIRHSDLRFSPSGMRNLAGGGVMGPWHLDENFGSSLLEEFKSNKTKCFELSEIAGHVVEFSADQYGSRFIQQKLETATIDEKNMVYQEIMPQSLALMTDVFGNYVVQKFFEHGLPNQRRELASKLFGHVLTLSLQMYGCRVIQKAIEVVDLDQKIVMVGELDGQIMRCVRDQNGNHVIQKCIECVPEENIQFIVTTFFDQVITLSTHPYGCRVIQRILEHCSDPKTQEKVMREILASVSMLAQDQYGNYVVQHVLEHGKPDERSFIIKELAGKIVQMSQQKFASNVVEKCLTFGGPTERQLLVSEMLGTTDENEPLQAMMKDQFANYVVQKVLETCEDQQRELILSRIKVHLNALKKYTYGKHIVARVEKLVAAGGTYLFFRFHQCHSVSACSYLKGELLRRLYIILVRERKLFVQLTDDSAESAFLSFLVFLLRIYSYGLPIFLKRGWKRNSIVHFTTLNPAMSRITTFATLTC
ncbi:hypothetical protein ACFE04_011983 [Oxalis oulophora]